MLDKLENVGAAAIVAVPYLLANGIMAGPLAIIALLCMLPKAWHFRAWGLVSSYIAGMGGWVWSIF